MGHKLAPVERSVIKVLSDSKPRTWREIAAEVNPAEAETIYWWIAVLNRLNLMGEISFDGEMYWIEKGAA